MKFQHYSYSKNLIINLMWQQNHWCVVHTKSKSTVKVGVMCFMRLLPRCLTFPPRLNRIEKEKPHVVIYAEKLKCYQKLAKSLSPISKINLQL